MNKLHNLILRYLIILAIAIPNFYIIYTIFTPLTIYPIYFILNLFYETFLTNTTLLINNLAIDIIPACIAGAAYFLLIALNLLTPMDKKQRLYSLIFSISLFYIINLLRIFLFTILLIYSFKLFNLTHMFFWYFLSTLIVITIWFLTAYIFKIKQTPIYTDLNFLYKKSYFKK